MKSLYYDSENNSENKNETNLIKSLIKVSPESVQVSRPTDLPKWKQNIDYNNACLHNNQETRSLSLPDCAIDGACNLNGTSSSNENGDVHSCLLNENNSPDDSPNSLWFKTWPERYEKLRSTDTSPVQSNVNTPSPKPLYLHEDAASNTKTSDRNIKNKFTLNEALQNISLAYSPVTKQLHLVEKKDLSNTSSNDSDTIDTPKVNEVDIKEGTEQKRSGHKRTEAGSFSSTISTLSYISEPSTSGSLIGGDDRSVSSFNSASEKPRKKSITNFLSK